MLPDGSGLALAAQLRAARVAVVIHPSGATPEAREAVAAAGLPFLLKRSDLTVLAKRVLAAWQRVAA